MTDDNGDQPNLRGDRRAVQNAAQYVAPQAVCPEEVIGTGSGEEACRVRL